MPKVLIHCELCGKTCPSKEAAIDCENGHLGLEKLRFTGPFYSEGEELPTKILVHFDESPLHFAFYKLCQKGAKIIQ